MNQQIDPENQKLYNAFLAFMNVQQMRYSVQSVIRSLTGGSADTDRDAVILYIFTDAAAFTVLNGIFDQWQIDELVARLLSPSDSKTTMTGIQVYEHHRDEAKRLQAVGDPIHARIATETVRAFKAMLDGYEDFALTRLLDDNSIAWASKK